MCAPGLEALGLRAQRQFRRCFETRAALGARTIDGAVTNGVIYVFVELPDEELPALVEKLKKSSIAMQREIARKR